MQKAFNALMSTMKEKGYTNDQCHFLTPIPVSFTVEDAPAPICFEADSNLIADYFELLEQQGYLAKKTVPDIPLYGKLGTHSHELTEQGIYLADFCLNLMKGGKTQ